MSASALVVGASSAIGHAVAQSYASRGLDLVLWGRDRERLEAVARQCREGGAASARVVQVDVRDSEQLRRATQDAAASAQPLRHVVWAAGVFHWGRFDLADPAEVSDVITTGFTAAATTAHALLPALVANAPSTLVFIGSGAGMQAYPDNAAYVAAKHGLRGLAGALHLDVCDAGVTVSIISTGLVAAGAGLQAPAAQSHPHALVQPDDVAAAVSFVALPR